jgi:hypothetical protein
VNADKSAAMNLNISPELTLDSSKACITDVVLVFQPLHAGVLIFA